jgi:transketolase
MLRYVPAAELDRIRTLDADPYERVAAFADACRLNALYMIERAGSGHPARPSAARTSSPGSISR